MFRRPLALLGALLMVLGMAAPAGASDSHQNGREELAAARQRLGDAKPTRVLYDRGAQRGVSRVEPPANTVGVTSATAYEYEDEFGEFVLVVADVKNNTPARRAFIEIEAQFYDANDEPVGDPMSGFVFASQLAFGASSTAFAAGELIPPSAEYIEAVASRGDIIQDAPVGPLTVSVDSVTVGGGIRTYTVTVENPNTFTANEVYVLAGSYDAAGDIIDGSLPADSVNIPAKSDAAIVVELRDDPGRATSRVSFLAEGYRSVTFGTYVTSWNNYFNDVGNLSFRNDILWLAENGLTSGCAAGRYCPTANVRRDEMASFLSRALALTGTPADAFVDDNGNTHELAINRIKAAGITAGCNPAQQLYCPAANVRRDEMASFLSRALELTGTPPNAFTDDEGNTHELNINRVAQAGVTSGCGGTNYCPTQLVTRGQMAAFLRRAFEE